MDISVWALLVIAVVVLVGATLQRVSGMGLGLIGAPVLSVLVGPVAGVIIINVLAAANAVFQSVAVRRNIDWRQFSWIAPMMVAGAAPVAFLVHRLPTGPLQILVGTLVLAGLLVTTHMPHQRKITGRGYAMAAGAAGGAMNTIAGIAGPAITVYAQASRWPQRTFAPTLQPLFIVSGVVSLVAKELTAGESIVAGAPWHLWPIGLAMMLTGLWIGNRLAAVVPMARARKLAITVAGAGALVTLVRGTLEVL